MEDMGEEELQYVSGEKLTDYGSCVLSLEDGIPTSECQDVLGKEGFEKERERGHLSVSDGEIYLEDPNFFDYLEEVEEAETYSSLVKEFGDKLGCSKKTKEKAIDLVSQKSKAYVKKPEAVVSGAVYVASQRTDRLQTQKDIAEVASVSQETVSKRSAELCRELDIDIGGRDRFKSNFEEVLEKKGIKGTEELEELSKREKYKTTYKIAMELHERGYGSDLISTELQMPPGTISHWLYEGAEPRPSKEEVLSDLGLEEEEIEGMDRKEKHERAKKYHEEKGYGSRRLAQALNLPESTVTGWLYEGREAGNEGIGFIPGEEVLSNLGLEKEEELTRAEKYLIAMEAHEEKELGSLLLSRALGEPKGTIRNWLYRGNECLEYSKLKEKIFEELPASFGDEDVFDKAMEKAQEKDYMEGLLGSEEVLEMVEEWEERRKIKKRGLNFIKV